ncbi:Repetin [Streptomyces somaliensis]|uniref:Repetin n=1 Tax=Streptomyces somaliensis (strain ATCC 33201 / DSM 40738 / JCM 12659 / KCTC 9044 / NCTC 11332 / NRRL B-12077 / IP 733) TaxID=1134445 RepID=A0AA44DG54_STRE0|nr:Repetin [Streptomyces somaliensis]NKY16009.1 Repetin [Streptomyces somaliensis DSM 40738]
MERRTRIAVFGAALLLTAGATGPAGAAGAAGSGAGEPEASARHAAAAPAKEAARGREAAALTGTAKLYRPGHDISFAFDAHLAGKDLMDPAAATGTFRLRHVFPDGTSGWARARVDCLVTGGRVAVVTGVVEESDRWPRGRRVGVTVHDAGRRDRLGYSWVTQDPQRADVPPCTSSAPFERVDGKTGDFRVLPWQPVYG